MLGDTTPTATLTVTVSNIESDKGWLTVSVYGEEATWLQDATTAEARLNVVEHLEDGAISTRFELATGEYAVAVYQDVNSSGEMDRNFLGVPKEPYGFSNDVVPKFGPPEFEAAAFTLGDASAVSIQLRN